MPTTSLGLRYPSSTDDVRPYEDLQFLATDTNDTFVDRNPLYGVGKLSPAQNLTNTITDLAGCSVTINVPTAQAVAWVSLYADCRLTVAGTTSTFAVINAVVDGVTLPDPQPVAGFGNMAVQTNSRFGVSVSFPVALSGSGNHTFKMQGAMSTASGTIQCAATLTQIGVLVLPY